MDGITVFDGHNDTLLNLHLPDRGEGRSFFERSDLGHIDLPRAREGGFGGGFFACYVPNPEDDGWTEESALNLTDDGYEVSDAPRLDPNYAKGFADGLVAVLFELESEGGLRVVRTAEELEGCLREGIVAAVLHFEGAENLGSDPGALEELYEAGLRSLGLVWSRPNAYAHGVPFRFPSSPDTGPGGSSLGSATGSGS
jgi:membrane dipeptidase